MAENFEFSVSATNELGNINKESEEETNYMDHDGKSASSRREIISDHIFIKISLASTYIPIN